MLIKKFLVFKFVERVEAILLPKNKIDLLFVLLQEPVDQLSKILTCVTANVSNSVEEEVVTLDLSRVQPGDGGPYQRVHTFDQFPSLLRLHQTLSIYKIDMFLR